MRIVLPVGALAPLGIVIQSSENHGLEDNGDIDVQKETKARDVIERTSFSAAKAPYNVPSHFTMTSSLQTCGYTTHLNQRLVDVRSALKQRRSPFSSTWYSSLSWYVGVHSSRNLSDGFVDRCPSDIARSHFADVLKIDLPDLKLRLDFAEQLVSTFTSVERLHQSILIPLSHLELKAVVQVVVELNSQRTMIYP